jgi:glycosyltransferase involved in cell wall biosynthesis
VRIAQVIDDLRVGGAERLFVDLVNALPEDEKFVILLNENEVIPNLEASLRPEIDVYKIRIRKRTLYLDIVRFARLLRKLKCDVVHSHTFWANFYGSVAARMAHVPVIVTSEHGRNEWKRGWHKWIESEVISRCAQHRLCVSQDILERRRDVDGIPGERLMLVPNGTVVPGMDDHREPDGIVIGSVGRLVVAKDYPSLVRALGLLRKRGIECRLEIVGAGPEESSIIDEVNRLSLNRYVTLAGFQQNVGDWLSSWTIFAVSSINEGQPVALLEAMARGLPCVVTSVGGIPDTLENEKEGLIVSPRDPEALAGALHRLIENPKLRRQLGSSARDRVCRDFSIDALASGCCDIYRSALESGAGCASS